MRDDGVMTLSFEMTTHIVLNSLNLPMAPNQAISRKDCTVLMAFQSYYPFPHIMEGSWKES